MTLLQRGLFAVAVCWLITAAVWFVPDRLLGGSALDLQRRAEQIDLALADLLTDAETIGRGALISFPPQDELFETLINPTLRERVEGVGILDPDGAYLVWEGSPVEPPSGFLSPDAARWWIERRGSRARLLVRTGPDSEGWRSLASLTLSGGAGSGKSFTQLLPQELLQDVVVELTPLQDLEADDEARLHREWRPAGESALGALSIEARRSNMPRQIRGWSRSLAALVTLLFLFAGIDWRRRIEGEQGARWTAAALLVIVGGRTLLSACSALDWLLPEGATSAGRFGVGSLGSWLGSPADLFASGLAAYLISIVLRRRWLATEGFWRRRWLPLLLTLVGSLLCGQLVMLVADHSQMGRLADTIFPQDARLLILVGLALCLLAVATHAAELLSRTRSAQRSSLSTSLPVVLCFSALALATAVVLQHRDAESQLEHLRVDIAPQVLEQSQRRQLALAATIKQVQSRFEDPRPEEVAIPSDRLAFYYWSESPLANAGYQSALDFYDLNSQLRSHFGFDLPELDEPVGPWDGPQISAVEEEPFQPVPSVRQKLLHAEAPLSRDGEPRGGVVAHVLDEPENLPFLPATRAYLAALGQERENAEEATIHYVVYDAQGTPLRSTLTQPPAETGTFRLAALDEQTVTVRAGDEQYVGIALGERDRLHLLLVAEAGLLERGARAIRFLLLGLSVVGAALFVPQCLRPGGLRRLLAALRGSFQRKLVAALLVASIVPLLGLSLLLRGFIESRADEEVTASAIGFVSAAQKLLEDATTPLLDDDVQEFDDSDNLAGVDVGDNFLLWLRRVVGQDVHVYEQGRLLASSKRELFDAGVLPERLDGWIHRQITIEGRASLVRSASFAGRDLPVAYAPVRSVDSNRQWIVAVPMVQEPGGIQREVQRVGEIILVSTVLLVAVLLVAATVLARTVARPVRTLVGATAQIAAGNYEARLETDADDEIADLVRGFNAMAGSLRQQRATLEQRREYIETLLRHATTGVLSIDRDGRVVTLNPSATAQLARQGVRVETGIHLALALESSDAFRTLSTRLRDRRKASGEPFDLDLQQDGQPTRLRVTQVPLPGEANQSVGQLILIDDVTELMRSNQLAAWAEMARAIAHEIKNPLTPIQLSTEHMRRMLHDRGILPDEKLDACLETVLNQVRTLYEIAGEFSTYAKLPVLNPEPCSAVEFMRETIAPYRVAPIEGVEIAERYQEVPTVAIDRRVLARALVNLIENGLQAMPEGGQLLAEVLQVNSDWVELAIEDSGVGLAPEVRQRLFEPYFSTKSSGTGLGLAIAKRAVEAHRGSIDVVSAEKGGSRFRIRLPVNG